MSSIWLPLFALFYIAVMLYWVRNSVAQASGSDGFFSAGHSLAPWISALVISGASLTGWYVLGGAQQISLTGLQLPVLLVSGILVALPGVVFFKRLWLVAERLRVSSQAGLFQAYYKSPFLVIVSTFVALLFALGFAGLQLRFLAQTVEALTDGTVSRVSASAVMGFVIFAGAGVGGARALAHFGVIQTVLSFCAIVLLAGFTLVFSGGFAALNEGLLALYSNAETTAVFGVKNVVLFTQGLGRGADIAKANTALASLSFAFALMGFQASPLIMKLVFSTRGSSGIAAGQTWVTAGFLGGLIISAVTIIGLAGLLDEGLQVENLLARIATQSPWFGAWAFIGLVAGVQLLAGLSLFVAAESLVRHIYRPNFNGRLSKKSAVSLTQIAVALLVLIALLLQNLAPVAVTAFAAVALSIALQLWTPLLGITWFSWITRPAAISGVGFGIAAVLLTEPLGYEVLSFFGLELPWGRWPWTIHSALWGLAANATAVLIISAITNRDDISDEAREIRNLFSQFLVPSKMAQTLGSTSWSLTLAWFFLFVGPGLIFGTSAFVDSQGTWLLGVPSLWVWSFIGWMSGVGLIWFLSYKMEMATPLTSKIPAYVPPLRLKKDNSKMEQQRLRNLTIACAVGFMLAALLALGFGS